MICLLKWTYGVDIIYYYYTSYDVQIKNIYHAIFLSFASPIYVLLIITDSP